MVGYVQVCISSFSSQRLYYFWRLICRYAFDRKTLAMVEPKPTNQPTSQPANQPTSQPANQPTSQPTNQPTNQPASDSQIGRVFASPEPAGACKKPTSWGSSAEDFHHVFTTEMTQEINLPRLMVLYRSWETLRSRWEGVLDILKETAET